MTSSGGILGGLVGRVADEAKVTPPLDILQLVFPALDASEGGGRPAWEGGKGARREARERQGWGLVWWRD